MGKLQERHLLVDERALADEPLLALDDLILDDDERELPPRDFWDPEPNVGSNAGCKGRGRDRFLPVPLPITNPTIRRTAPTIVINNPIITIKLDRILV